ncbi:MAG: hypothetical protein QXE80_03590 [Pyrobaculum sp.]
MQGAGTQVNPYVIENVADFYSIPSILAARNNPNVRIYFRLATDLDLTGINHTPFDMSNVEFEGMKYTIYGLNRDSSTTDNLALFRTLTNVKIKELVLKFNTVIGRDGVALLAVSAVSSQLERIGVYSCTVRGRNTVGGMLAQAVDSNIRECFVENTTIEGQQTIGGLIAIVSGQCEITQSYTRATIRQSGSGQIVGGFIGWLKRSPTVASSVTFCFADTEISAQTSTDVRGFIGRISF